MFWILLYQDSLPLSQYIILVLVTPYCLRGGKLLTMIVESRLWYLEAAHKGKKKNLSLQRLALDYTRANLICMRIHSK